MIRPEFVESVRGYDLVWRGWKRHVMACFGVGGLRQGRMVLYWAVWGRCMVFLDWRGVLLVCIAFLPTFMYQQLL